MDHATTDKLDGLQVLRGLAATAVVFHHVLEESSRQLQAPGWLVRAGAAGVDVFFVLSGFIMLYAVPKGPNRTHEAWSFLVRRILRIGPLYWLFVILVALIHMTGVFYRSLYVTPATLVKSLCFIERKHLVLGVAWTLNYETYFYLIFALAVCLVQSTKSITFLVSTLIVSNLFLRGGLTDPDWTRFLANPIALEFVAGMLLALLYKRIAIHNVHLKYLICLLAVVFICFASPLEPVLNTNGLTGWNRLIRWGLPAAAITLCCLNATPGSTRFARALIGLGNASYAIYLSHPILMTTYAWVLLRTHFAESLIVFLDGLVICTALLIGCFVHTFVEKPLAARFKRLQPVSKRRHLAPSKTLA